MKHRNSKNISNLAKTFEKFSSNSEINESLPVDLQVESSSKFLSNMKITIIGGGGIAATELPKLSRELRRHGASTQFCITENCLKFIGIDSLRWASGNEVIINPTGLAEHICAADALVVCPATADLISKSVNGICSDGATTLIQSALGLKKTIIFCATMHESLTNSPIIKQNREKLTKIPGVFFTTPRFEEGKEKLPSHQNLAIEIAHIINKAALFNSNSQNIIITAGGTRIMIDPVRCITNLSTGSLGIEVAKVFYAMGIQTKLILGNTNVEVPEYQYQTIVNLPEYEDMYNYVKNINEKDFDGIIHLVAGSDFICKNKFSEKISSTQEKVHLELNKTKKIIDLENISKIRFKAAAKLTSGKQEEGIKAACEHMQIKQLNAILYSNIKDIWKNNNDHNAIFIENKDSILIKEPVSGKKDIALKFFSSFIKFKG